MYIINQGRVNFEYKKSEEEPIITETEFSNKVYTYLIYDKLKVEKYVDKVIASIFDVLTYTITILNISEECVENIIFRDFIPSGTGFINNSIKINGVKKRCTAPYEDLYIGNLDKGEHKVICFKVVILNNTVFKELKNHGRISYDYIYNVEEEANRRIIKTNEVSTSVKNTLFTQFGIQSYIKLSCIYFESVKVNKVLANIDILKVKLINDINGYKILIVAIIKYKIIYTKYSTVYISKKLSTIYTDIFSRLVSVPEGAKYFQSYNIKALIENIDFYIFNKNNLVINIQMLLNIC